MNKGRTGILALCSLGILGTASMVFVSTARAASDSAKARPIFETHIHTWQATRPGGIPWPPPANKVLFRDIAPEEFEKLAKPMGFTGSGIVEASNTQTDNLKVLDLIKGNKFFHWFVASVEVGSPDFIATIDKLSKSPKFVGVRSFLQAPEILLDGKQVADLKELAKRGLSLDIISRGTKNPKDKVAAIAAAVPNLKIIIDHLGGAKGKVPDAGWVKDMEKLAAHKNVYMKFSSYFDMYNTGPNEDNSWKAPTDLDSYKAHFDVLMKNFGADRLIYGSNWPVVVMGGTLENHIRIAEEYLKPLGNDVRDKVMYKNAKKFYERSPMK